MMGRKMVGKKIRPIQYSRNSCLLAPAGIAFATIYNLWTLRNAKMVVARCALRI
jgi:hypothetical protein